MADGTSNPGTEGTAAPGTAAPKRGLPWYMQGGKYSDGPTWGGYAQPPAPVIREGIAPTPRGPGDTGGRDYLAQQMADIDAQIAALQSQMSGPQSYDGPPLGTGNGGAGWTPQLAVTDWTQTPEHQDQRSAAVERNRALGVNAYDSLDQFTERALANANAPVDGGFTLNGKTYNSWNDYYSDPDTAAGIRARSEEIGTAGKSSADLMPNANAYSGALSGAVGNPYAFNEFDYHPNYNPGGTGELAGINKDAMGRTTFQASPYGADPYNEIYNPWGYKA